MWERVCGTLAPSCGYFRNPKAAGRKKKKVKGRPAFLNNKL